MWRRSALVVCPKTIAASSTHPDDASMVWYGNVMCRRQHHGAASNRHRIINIVSPNDPRQAFAPAWR